MKNKEIKEMNNDVSILCDEKEALERSQESPIHKAVQKYFSKRFLKKNVSVT